MIIIKNITKHLLQQFDKNVDMILLHSFEDISLVSNCRDLSCIKLVMFLIIYRHNVRVNKTNKKTNKQTNERTNKQEQKHQHKKQKIPKTK